MGSLTSKFREENEGPPSPKSKENTVSSSSGLKIIQLDHELDPRSPSSNVARTPLQFLSTSDKKAEELSTPAATPAKTLLIDDPRSPTTEYNRTPVVVNVVKKSPVFRIHNKNLDNVLKGYKTYSSKGKSEVTPNKSNVVPPKLLETSPMRIIKPDHYKRRSFVGVLETNVDYTETNLDDVFMRKYSSAPLRISTSEQNLRSNLRHVLSEEIIDPRSPTADIARTPVHSIRKLDELDDSTENLLLKEELDNDQCESEKGEEVCDNISGCSPVKETSFVHSDNPDLSNSSNLEDKNLENSLKLDHKLITDEKGAMNSPEALVSVCTDNLKIESPTFSYGSTIANTESDGCSTYIQRKEVNAEIVPLVSSISPEISEKVDSTEMEGTNSPEKPVTVSPKPLHFESLEINQPNTSPQVSSISPKISSDFDAAEVNGMYAVKNSQTISKIPFNSHLKHENLPMEKLNLTPVRRIDLTADVKDFDKKLSKLIYEDSDDASIPLSSVKKDTHTNRTPLGLRNSNSEPKKKQKLKVSDKPRCSNVVSSRIPVFQSKNGKKISVQCENTPPKNIRVFTSGKYKKPQWDNDNTLII